MTFVIEADGGQWPVVDRAELLAAAPVLFEPGARYELRSLPSGRSRLVSPDDPEALADAAGAVGEGARGVYYTLNPVRPDLGDASACNADVLRRRWLLVDVDPVKADPDASSTRAEKLAALALASDVFHAMLARGWPEPVVVDSGNGFHLLWRVVLPNDEPTRALVRDALKALAREFDRDGARVDKAVHNASRIAKLPGTWARKGPDTPDRPHRPCRVLTVPAAVEPVPTDLIRALAAGADAPSTPAAAPANGFVVTASDGGARVSAYARSALLQELARVAMAQEGDRNNALNEAAFKVGTLVGAGLLDRPTVEAQLELAASRAGLSAAEARATIRSGLGAGTARPRDVPGPPGGKAFPGASAGPDATVAHLRTLQSSASWVWGLWVPNASLTLVAAEAGTGKTRFCFDLHRRIVHGLEWPDGARAGAQGSDRALWVVADNQWQEMCDLAAAFGIDDDLVVLNAPASDPYDGTSLQTADELDDFEARVKRVRPAVVFIDTITNTGDFKAQDSSDAKRQYKPLQEIAVRCQVPVVCVTHLNAGGKVLGRRAVEKVRVVIQMECPDPEGQPFRRRLWVSKSKAVRPPALGVTMGDGGNEYDESPPEAPGPARHNGATTGPAPTKIAECMHWLQTRLGLTTVRVSRVRNESERAGFQAGTLYRAKERLNVIETEADGYKFWAMPALANGHHDQPF